GGPPRMPAHDAPYGGPDGLASREKPYGGSGGLAGRAVAGFAAGALSGAALTLLGPAPPVAASAAAPAIGIAVALMPRLAWLLVTGALLAWLAGVLPGVALLAAAAT